jgi:hypothetical protein
MRLIPILRNSVTLVLLAYFFGPAAVFAHVPRTREAEGIIRSIDQQKQTLVLDCGRERGPRRLAWKADTTFSRAGKSIPASSLKQGVTVLVYYHSPLLGKPFVSEVVCLQ